MKLGVSLAALAAAMAVAAPASALNINLVDDGTVAGTAAEAGFEAAARFWEDRITNNVTLNFLVGYSDLGPGILGGTGSNLIIRQNQFIEARIVAGGSNSAVDQQVRSATGMPALTNTGALTVVTPGYVDTVNQLGIDNETAVLDADDSFNNHNLAVTVANARALGYVFAPGTIDAQIQFSSSFAFDFSPGNGIGAGQYDFIGVAIHEMGHALGFVSGADDYDFLGCPNGPGCSAFDDYPVNDDWWGYTMDLFRYSTDFDGQARLDWRPGVDAYFSLDRGATELYGRGDLSQGTYHGNFGDQASHWLANNTCANFVGVMNPYLCSATNAIVRGQDIAALDAIGWNFVDGVQGQNYAFSTAAIPEPTTWAMLILGLGGMGAVLRRRRALALA